MNVLGISGSHREKGNTALLIKRVLEKCKDNQLDISYVNLAKKDIKFCLDCGYCRTNKHCVIDDDVNEILGLMRHADAIIIGSPCYFGGITGRLRSLFDRTLPPRRDHLALSQKIGGAITVGGSRNGGQEFTISDIHRWMLIHEMTVVGDHKTAHFGGICVGRSPGDVLDDEVGLKTVDNLAERIIQILNQKNEL